MGLWGCGGQSAGVTGGAGGVVAVAIGWGRDNPTVLLDAASPTPSAAPTNSKLMHYQMNVSEHEDTPTPLWRPTILKVLNLRPPGARPHLRR